MLLISFAVEDPSESFQRVRDFVDAKNCLNLSSFQSDKIHQGFCDDMVQETREKFKLSKVCIEKKLNMKKMLVCCF